jgi:hypothetical protein
MDRGISAFAEALHLTFGEVGTMEMKNFGRELEHVTNLFISSNGGNNSSPKKATDKTKEEEEKVLVPDFSVEVEENVSVQKKMAFPAVREGQIRMKNTLLDFIQNDYMVTRVELKKKTDLIEEGKKTVKDEELILFLRDSGQR